MQAKYRRKPNEYPVGDECDVAENGKDTQEAHVLGQERQQDHGRGDVTRCIGQYRHGSGLFPAVKQRRRG